jgi:hypothetical protein
LGKLNIFSRGMSKELKDFYKKRTKQPSLYTYDDEGNLIILNTDGAVTKTINLPTYRRPTYEEIDEMEKKRLTAIAIANKEFDDLRKELRSAYENKQMSDSEILSLNRRVREADIKLQSIRFPLKFVEFEGPIEVSKIDFNQPNEKRKYPYDFAFLKTNPFKLTEQYTRIGELPKAPLKTVEEIKAAADIPVILFYEPDTNEYGFLSLKWVVEIEFNGTMYNSAYQALYAEIAKGFNDQDNLSKIMLAETPDEIEYSLDMVPGESETNEPKWNDLTKRLLYDVNIAKFNQYPELTDRLLNTKNAILGAYEPDDNLIGIGISLDNVQAKNPVNWTGQNLLGKAIMEIRNKIRSDREAQQISTQASRVPRRRPQVASLQPAITPPATPSTPLDLETYKELKDETD